MKTESLVLLGALGIAGFYFLQRGLNQGIIQEGRTDRVELRQTERTIRQENRLNFWDDLTNKIFTPKDKNNTNKLLLNPSVGDTIPMKGVINVLASPSVGKLVTKTGAFKTGFNLGTKIVNMVKPKSNNNNVKIGYIPTLTSFGVIKKDYGTLNPKIVNNILN
jgi:hypothetical protein